MSTLTGIKSRILELEGGAFQEFCDAFLYAKGYEDIFELGMKSGTMKTTTGNPDTYFKTKTGKYIFVAYTTQESEINKKIREDIEKCLDSKKTGVDIENIDTIICCHTSSTLKAGADKELKDMCKKHKVRLQLFGIDKIANEIYLHYQFLAADHLGLKIDSNQIFSVKEFVRRYDANEMAASLSTIFQFRVREKTQIIDALKKSTAVVIAGNAGVGKTRLAIEALTEYGKRYKYKLLCIKSNDLPIAEDICRYINKPGKYLVFVDDADELAGLHYILEYLTKKDMGYDVRIAVTVRNYAFQKVKGEIKDFTIPENIFIPKFTDDEIKGFLDINLGVNNQTYVEQIIRIAEGNPRIAFMAGRLAREKNKLEAIQDAAQLYENYYEKYLNGIIIITDSKICLTAGIISILRTVQLNHLDALKPIFDVAGITQEEFCKNTDSLYRMECVDKVADRVVHISDQCLGNYILYYAFIVRKLIPFTKLIDTGFRHFREGIINSIQIFVSVFYSDDVLEYLAKEIKQVWDDYKTNDALLYDFVKAFHTFNPEGALLYAKAKIDEIQKKEVDVNNIVISGDRVNSYERDTVLQLLTGYAYNDNLAEAIDLMLEYCLKCPNISSELFLVLKDNYSVDGDASLVDYYVQKMVVNKLIAHMEKSIIIKKLFFEVAKEYLSLVFFSTKAGRRNSIVFCRVSIGFSEGSMQYRRDIWNQLLILAKDVGNLNSIYQILLSYPNTVDGKVESSIKVLNFDLPHIVAILKELEDRGQAFMVAYICSRLFRIDKFCDIHLKERFSSAFSVDEWKVYEVLSETHLDIDLKFEEAERERRKNIQNYMSVVSAENMGKFIKTANQIMEEPEVDEWDINCGLDTVCSVISEDRGKLIAFVHSYIKFGDRLRPEPGGIIKALFQIYPADEVMQIIWNAEFNERRQWQMTFFMEIPEHEITKQVYEKLLEFLYQEIGNPKYAVRINLYVLEKFRNFCQDIYVEITNTIVHKPWYSPWVADIYFSSYFRGSSFTPVELLYIFKGNETLLQDIYFKCLVHNRNVDSKGKFLMEFIKHDISWVQRYISYTKNIINKSGYGYSQVHCDRIMRCWSLDNYIKIFDDIFQGLLEDEELSYGYEKYLASLLTSIKGEDGTEIKKDWILHLIEDYCHSENIVSVFNIISNLQDNIRKECIVTFVNLNSDFEIFRRLAMDNSMFEGEKSIGVKIAFYESLLPELLGVPLLRHKQFIKEKIESWKGILQHSQEDEILTKLYRGF